MIKRWDLEKNEGCCVVAHERLTESRVTMSWLLAKPKSFSNLPAFLDLNGSKTYVFPLPWILASITKGNSPGSPNLTFSLQSKNMSHLIYYFIYDVFDQNSFLKYELVPDLFSVGLQVPIAKSIEILIILLSISPNNAGVAG